MRGQNFAFGALLTQFCRDYLELINSDSAIVVGINGLEELSEALDLFRGQASRHYHECRLLQLSHASKLHTIQHRSAPSAVIKQWSVNTYTIVCCIMEGNMSSAVHPWEAHLKAEQQYDTTTKQMMNMLADFGPSTVSLSNMR